MGCFVALAGCSSPPATASCTVGSAEGCEAGQTCEAIEGSDEGGCFSPVHVRGRVFDLVTDEAVADARVLAIDANGAAISDVVTSAADGTYELPVAAARSSDGTPISHAITLRVDAAGYQTFPTAPRTALPVDLGSGTDDGAGFVVENAATDIGLLPEEATGVARIEGVVDADDPGGVLVVAEQGGVAVRTAVSDLSGAFVVFDVPEGATHLVGYRAGLRVTPVDLTVAAPASSGVVLHGETDGLGTVSGSVNIVNGGGASTTSVILVVESTFVENAARGEAPAGLRAGDVTNAFEITDVPPGRYVVLAAFENDGLVRDPDTSIGGTSIVHIEVPAGGGDVSLEESFKVTGALAVVSPGADELEVVEATPTLIWADDSSEDGYELRVYDAFGALVHMTDVARVSGSAEVSYAWAGPALEPGMIYQFRATSFHDERDGRVYISATEDLRGVFQIAP